MQDFFKNLFSLIADLFLSDKIGGKDAGILATLGMMLDELFSNLSVK